MKGVVSALNSPSDEGNTVIRQLTLVETNGLVTTLVDVARKPDNACGIGTPRVFPPPEIDSPREKIALSLSAALPGFCLARRIFNNSL